MVFLHRDQTHKNQLEPNSTVPLKEGGKVETNRTNVDVKTMGVGEFERQESFLRNAIIKDEERRQRQVEEAYKKRRLSGAVDNAGIGSGSYTGDIIETGTLKFRPFVEESSEIEDDIKGESQNEDDEKDDDDSEEEDSSEEKDNSNSTSSAFKKRKSFRIKPDPKYNGKHSFEFDTDI